MRQIAGMLSKETCLAWQLTTPPQEDIVQQTICSVSTLESMFESASDKHSTLGSDQIRI